MAVGTIHGRLVVPELSEGFDELFRVRLMTTAGFVVTPRVPRRTHPRNPPERATPSAPRVQPREGGGCHTGPPVELPAEVMLRTETDPPGDSLTRAPLASSTRLRMRVRSRY